MKKGDREFLERVGPEWALTNDALALVKEDLEYGVAQEDIEGYLDKDFITMKMMSKCLRSSMPHNVLQVIMESSLYPIQQQTILDGWQNGVPAEVLLDIAKGKELAHVMRKKCDNYLLSEKKELHSILADLKRMLGQIKNTDKKEMGVSELEQKPKPEMKVKVPEAQKDIKSIFPGKEEMQNDNYSLVIDGNIYPLEKTKKRTSFVGGLFAKMFKKKSTENLIDLVLKKKLQGDQIAVISSAYEKGLTEDQLCDLINAKLPSATMEEIVRLGILVNKNEKE